MASSDIIKLNRKRGAVKAQLTQFKKFLDTNITSRLDDVLDDVVMVQLKERLIRFEGLLIEFRDIQSELELIVDGSEIENQYEERAAFEENFYDLLSEAKNVLSKFDNGRSSRSSSPRSGTRSSAKHSSQYSKNNNSERESGDVQLPIIPLPKFNGDENAWLEFRDSFNSLIHNKQTLSDIQKFHYLRASLEGEAAQAIKSVKLSDKGYPVAWQILCERFDDPKLLQWEHIQAIFALEVIQKESSSKLRRLVDDLTQHLESLVQLGQNTENWDPLLIFIVVSKLDNQTSREWEKHTSSLKQLPNLNSLLTFIKERANFLKTMELKNRVKLQDKTNEKTAKFRDTKHGSKTLLSANSNEKSYTIECSYCQQNHAIYTCEKFLDLDFVNRKEFVSKAKLCLNCLRAGHNVKKCRLGPCKKCREWHNSLLHDTGSNKNTKSDLNAANDTKSDTQVRTQNNSKDETTCQGSSSLQIGLESTLEPQNYVFLSTACVQVLDRDGSPYCVRAVLDPGSQISIISESLFEKLRIPMQKMSKSIYGVGDSQSLAKGKCSIIMRSSQGHFETPIKCFILPSITNVFPPIELNRASLNIPDNLKLADPKFSQPGVIELLIGADLCGLLLRQGIIYCGEGKPIIQKTVLGWIISGEVNRATSLATRTVSFLSQTKSNQELHAAISKFWELEEGSNVKHLSEDEHFCEEHFRKTTVRNEDGRFVVTMPLKQSAESLGESKTMAEKRFYSLERKLHNNKQLLKSYTAFLSEYIELGHMTLDNKQSNIGIEYYAPHHCVIREDSLTTKLRVVFDSSAPTSNGLSLNSIQAVGPVLQDDLQSILLRFRKHSFVVSADIAKMYRQVQITPEQRNLQKIFWRNSSQDPLQTYTLNTVTYGQASASYLAIKCLFVLAEEQEKSNPVISNIIKHDFYVDDMLTGADTIAQTQSICKNISKVLKSGCFELRKWYSNNSEVLKGLDVNQSCNLVEFAPNECAKTLGLMWSCQNDSLLYRIKTDDLQSEKLPTKRSVLSLISKIFDPLGLASPTIIISKILMQRAWSEKIAWDEPLSDSLQVSWKKFKNELPSLNDLKIPRHVICKGAVEIELHGFADASTQAYGACVYLRSTDQSGEVLTSLLAAKSKVAPLKVVSVPRLELCAILLLSRLTDKIVQAMKIEFKRVILWSDSTVALAWLKTSSSALKTFVANRVSEAQSLTKNYEWRYVPTNDNPADLVSRGVFPSELKGTTLWWDGPEWLSREPTFWPSLTLNVDVIPELKSHVFSMHVDVCYSDFPFDKFSKFSRMQRVVAYIRRFLKNCRLSKSDRQHGPLTLFELNSSTKTLAKISQQQSFPKEFLKLNSGEQMGTKNPLASLCPYIDKEQIIRVGGRLSQSHYAYDKRHPILLHAKHRFTKLLFEFEHIRLMHGGPQLLLAHIREKYWPLGGRNLARAIVKSCLKCYRFKPRPTQPIMGNLPPERTTPSTPFTITGVDYAGPFLLRDRKGRGFKSEKCYVSLFICLATKAVHLEVVSSLSTESFLQALRRFTSRRGLPSKIMSDNATNFVGAQRELGKFFRENSSNIVSACSNDQIDWQFIPPYSPHFGGLWEAGVRCTKHHLRHVLSEACLTFEEFTTVISQIEAILNSRPLCPLSNDPNDLSYLTPAHFLVGKTLLSAPDENLMDVKMNRLSRFQLVQRLSQHFWRRWKKEYIAELQQRVRWKINQSQLKIGELVLLKDKYDMPTQWKLGRVVQVHKGPDGTVRVATVKTITGLKKRSFPSICPLPVQN